MSVFRNLTFIVLSVLAASALASEPIHVVVMGDNRQMNHYAEQPLVLRKMINDIVSQNPDFIFHTGDFIRGYSSNSTLIEAWYKEWFEITEPLKDKIFIAPGNHDIWSKYSLDLYLQKIGPTYFTKEIGPTVFFVLNSWFPDQVNQITGEQFTWLATELGKYKNKKFKFVMIHSPAVSSGPHEGNCLDEHPAERDQFVSLLQENKVNVLFCGHEHVYDDRMIGSVRQIITGGGGSDLYKIKGKEQFHHYLRLTITDKDYSVETVMVEDPLPDLKKVLRKGKNASQAILELGLVRQQYPKANDILLYLGLAYAKTGNRISATQYFSEYLDARNNSPFAYGYMMDMLEKYEMPDMTLPIIEKGYQNDSSSPTLGAMYARELILAGRIDEGRAILEQITASEDMDADLLYLIGNAYEFLAGEYYKMIIKHNDENPYRDKAKDRLKSIQRLDSY